MQNKNVDNGIHYDEFSTKTKSMKNDYKLTMLNINQDGIQLKS